MPRPFLEVFPRELRNQIYRGILESPSGAISLSPWCVEVARSLSILRVCKQIHRECKDIIWLHMGLHVREPTQIYREFAQIEQRRQVRARWVTISLEMMDRDELEWISSGLRAIQNWHRIESITLRTAWENPRDVVEFQDILRLRRCGEFVDGRLVQDSSTPLRVDYNTGWPPLSHWGKQKWLKMMLLDPSGIDELLRGLNDIFGGELYVDGGLCFKDKMQVAACNLDPRNGVVRIVPESRVLKQATVS